MQYKNSRLRGNVKGKSGGSWREDEEESNESVCVSDIMVEGRKKKSK